MSNQLSRFAANTWLVLFPVAIALSIGIVSTNRQCGLNFPPLPLFKMLTCFDHFTPSISFFVLAEIIHQRQYIGVDVFISWIGEADQICGMNFSNIRGLHGIAYLKSQLDAPIYWRRYNCEEHFSPLCLFLQTSPNNLAVASENANKFFTQKLHVQIENKLRSPQCRTKVQLLSPFQPT